MVSTESQLRVTRPVFLVGCHRSGTTLARFLLDSHPNIACPPESKFFSALHDLIGYPQVVAGFRSMRLSRQEALSEIGYFGRRLLDSYTVKAGKKRWIDKTPNYYRILPFLRDIFGGEVLFVFMVRHPIDTIISLDEYFRDATSRFEDPEIANVVGRNGVGLPRWARYWNEVYESICVFAADPRHETLFIRYEDLVSSPDGVLTQICAFMGEPFTTDCVATAWLKMHDFGMEDNKIRRTKGIHSESVGRWKSLPASLVDVLWEIVGSRGGYFGYETGGPGLRSGNGGSAAHLPGT